MIKGKSNADLQAENLANLYKHSTHWSQPRKTRLLAGELDTLGRLARCLIMPSHWHQNKITLTLTQ
jgi:hypothetical protein